MVVLNVSLEVKFIVRPVASPHRIDEWVSDFRIVKGLQLSLFSKIEVVRGW